MAIMLLSTITFLPTPRGQKRDRPVDSFGGVFPETSPASDRAMAMQPVGPKSARTPNSRCACLVRVCVCVKMYTAIFASVCIHVRRKRQTGGR